MVNYSQGKVYKIMANGDPDGLVYIGSTCKQYLSQRMDKHRSHYKAWKEGKTNKVTVFDIFEKYGIDDCCIVLLELVNAANIDELHARERHWIQSTDCVNRIIPGRTKAEYRTDHSEHISQYQTQYRADNRERLSEYTGQYHIKHREQISQYQTQYRSDNRERLSQYIAEYYAGNRGRILAQQSEKVQCECGCSVGRNYLSKHKKTPRHLALVPQLNPR
jgi:hypothetical protein